MRARIFQSLSDRGQRAFTLIELMIVVVIIGILASLAFYNVSQYVRDSKTAEASAIISNIMGAQKAYFADTDRYLDVTGGVTSGANDFYPSDATFDGTQAIMWGEEDDGCNNAAGVACSANWKRIGVLVSSPVLFRYACTTFSTGYNFAPVSAIAPGFNTGSVTAPNDGFVVVAKSDLDGDGGAATVIVASSLNATPFTVNRGQ